MQQGVYLEACLQTWCMTTQAGSALHVTWATILLLHGLLHHLWPPSLFVLLVSKVIINPLNTLPKPMRKNKERSSSSSVLWEFQYQCRLDSLCICGSHTHTTPTGFLHLKLIMQHVKWYIISNLWQRCHCLHYQHHRRNILVSTIRTPVILIHNNITYNKCVLLLLNLNVWSTTFLCTKLLPITSLL